MTNRNQLPRLLCDAQALAPCQSCQALLPTGNIVFPQTLLDGRNRHLSSVENASSQSCIDIGRPEHVHKVLRLAGLWHSAR